MIRPLEERDYAAAADLLRTLQPDATHTEAGMRHAVETANPRARRRDWIAEDAGDVVGFATSFRQWWRRGNAARAWIGVRSDARRRGLGTALAERVAHELAELDAALVITTTIEDDGRRFADAHEFAVDRIERVSSVDPRTTDLAELEERTRAAEAAGFRVVTPRDVKWRALYEAEIEIGDDMPGSAPSVVSFEDWVADASDHPTVSWDGSTAIVRGGRVVTLCWLSVDGVGRRARNELTGTVREHRRRGLAFLAKLAALRWAADNGIIEVVTDNAEANVGMLAINERLGYRPLFARERRVRKLAG